mmetsp:Transcript_24333/g.55820  ORF Transcript_24333/g.55820 Transcript_24333/m.55820 type:complete len:88 (-) Transcript_24333:620-883(-)
MTTLPPQVEQVVAKVDAFMAKYPQVTQYGELSSTVKFCIFYLLLEVKNLIAVVRLMTTLTKRAATLHVKSPSGKFFLDGTPRIPSWS